ncbi:hypothetical protein HPT25_09985 [Bacillus sp. BRMEA1]|uniref:sensor histidine kinase n=1 Tax=Neobacillus endophyticus TaxID=2738405 RepID=UPI001565B075|nr:ATP-binding protein [Neobacillus endophyticus]NRD77749.1 hypothetical protein [Neobacillus endophyticus]
MNTFFVLIRLVSYLLLLGLTIYFGHSLTWRDWAVSILVMAWGTWDFWKKPNEDTKKLGYGVWIEAIAITWWIFSVQSDVLLYAYISPLARASIHLVIRDRLLFFITCCMLIVVFEWWVPGHSFIPLLVLLFVLAYSSLIGSLVAERQRSQQLLGLSEFEREQHIREQERVRISRQLHDTMGQYWTAVIRIMDVAEAVPMPNKQTYIQKARNAAESGLQEMRNIIRNSQDGKLTSEQWIDFALKSLERLKELTNIQIELLLPEDGWFFLHRRKEISELFARVIIESLTNAIRHGMATKVCIEVGETDQSCQLFIRDNGVGFQKEIHAGIGVQSIRELTRDAGGSFQIESKQNHGTTIKLHIPFKGGQWND